MIRRVNNQTLQVSEVNGKTVTTVEKTEKYLEISPQNKNDERKDFIRISIFNRPENFEDIVSYIRERLAEKGEL